LCQDHLILLVRLVEGESIGSDKQSDAEGKTEPGDPDRFHNGSPLLFGLYLAETSDAEIQLLRPLSQR
jgi:hypothetical protein